MQMPKIYDPALYEARWRKYWEDNRVYAFDRKDTARPTYTIDTPPPYPSGEFHMGNALNWCYFDFVARYKRMRGYNVHFPQGWDCHGLPTEVRVEREYGIRKGDVSPEQFKELCRKVTEVSIDKMKQAIKRMGISIDWGLEYRTMDPDYIRRVQLSFVKLYKDGYIYKGKHPVNWCPRCETAIAEAEVNYEQRLARFYYVRFETDGAGYATIATTRPELIPACVALAYNPKDERYSNIKGKEAIVPIFGRRVPIMADEAVDPGLGTGLVMICTYGDKADVRWQIKYGLPVIEVLSEKGLMSSNAGKYAGLTIAACRDAIVKDLDRIGALEKVEELASEVGLCWRCHTPVEILARPQWFMRTKAMTDQILKWVEELRWVPEFAKRRMVDWVMSLDWDWVISRQRIFGTPIPVWYCAGCGEIVVAESDELPVDPRSDRPRIEACPKCGSKNFQGEPDVFDTWMDSSITCAVHAGWPDDEELFRRLFPADLQPNGLDIIRTWDYYLLVRHLALFGTAPYKTLLINGMVRGTDGRMMHKSYGNYVEVNEAIDKYGSDAVRQWASAGGATGYDIPFRWEEVEYAKRFLTKLWNAARLVISNLNDCSEAGQYELDLVDRWLLSRLQGLISKVTVAMEGFQFNAALEAIRNFTWGVFCDHYLEAIKYRLYQRGAEALKSRRACQHALAYTLDIILRLLAPFCPHIAEELYHRLWKGAPKYKSIHVSPWPEPDPRLIDLEAEAKGDLIIRIISTIRHQKSQARLPLNAPLKLLRVYALGREREAIEEGRPVLMGATGAKVLEIKAEEAPPTAQAVRDYPAIKLEFLW